MYERNQNCSSSSTGLYLDDINKIGPKIEEPIF